MTKVVKRPNNINFRISDEMAEVLQRIAKEEDRTRSKVIVRLLEFALANIDNQSFETKGE